MIDGHVHILGTGAGGTGCWIRRRGFKRFLEPFLLREYGLASHDLKGDFDMRVVERLLAMIREAGLSRVLLLAQEEVYTERGERMPDRAAFHVPNTYVLRLAREHPEFVPAVSIHPARPDALDELERCLEGGAAVMKCLPNCQNIDPREPRYRRFWERMAEAGLPLLAHTGGEKALPVVRPDLADPRVLEVPLQIGVTVIAAHCGTTAGYGARHFLDEWIEMLGRHPRLFGDNSALALPGKGRFVERMLRAGVVERIVHGSDLPVPSQPVWMMMEGRLSWREYLRLRRLRNPLARDIAFKRALGFPEASFSRIETLWRRSDAVMAA